MARKKRYTEEQLRAYAEATAGVNETLAEYRALREQLAMTEREEHPPIVDRFGRVWYWRRLDLYAHDDTLALPKEWILDGKGGLPRPGLAEFNPNYHRLCEICRHGVSNALPSGETK